MTCGIHEHLLKTFSWSQECGLPGQDLPDITAVFTAHLTIINSSLPLNESFFFNSVGNVITLFPLHRLF